MNFPNHQIKSPNHQITNHQIYFAVLYASEGAPIGFIWWALPTLLRAADVPVDRITTLTAVVLLPWVFKFLWAPALDLLRGARWGYRSWIIAMQSLMALALVPLIWIDPVSGFEWWRALLVLHAVAAATQDVAIDALAIGVVEPEARGRLNGAMQAGMLIGRSVFGGGVLLIGTWLGREGMLIALIAWILAAMIGAVGLRGTEPKLRGTTAGFTSHLVSAFRLRTTWLGLVFAVISASAFEATGQLAGPYLVDREVSAAAIGAFFGIPVVGAMLIGGLVGGHLADRWGRYRMVALSLAGFVLPIVALAAVDAALATATMRMALLSAMYFFVGAFTASSYSVFMDLTDPRLGATQFSAFMAGTNACESWSVWAAGRLTAAQGYPAAFVVMSLVSLTALPLLALMRRMGSPASPAIDSAG